MFNEERLFDEFKKVRNRFRKYDAKFLIISDIPDYLNAPVERTKH